MAHYTAYVGLDVHKDSIAVAVAPEGGRDSEFLGLVSNTELDLVKLVRRLEERATGLIFCYEAGPCGYGVYRLIRSLGEECMVVAPSLIPRRPGDRVKNDRRDAHTLARLCRSGDLTAVWVPDEEHEAIRDLTRAREDMKAIQRHGRQRLVAFLLRHDIRYAGRTRWTSTYYRWLEGLKFARPVSQIVFQEYVDTITEAQVRVKAMEEEIQKAVADWSMRPVRQPSWPCEA